MHLVHHYDFWICAQCKCNRLFDNPSVVWLHLVVNPSLKESLSVGTCSSCGASLFRLLLHASNICITQLLQAVVFLQICTLAVLVFSANLLSSWLILVARILKPTSLICCCPGQYYGLLSDPTSCSQNMWIMYCTNTFEYVALWG